MRRFQDRVDYALAGRVAVVTLDRPDRLNAFDGAMYEGVNEAMLYFRDDADAWVAVLDIIGRPYPDLALLSWIRSHQIIHRRNRRP